MKVKMIFIFQLAVRSVFPSKNMGIQIVCLQSNLKLLNVLLMFLMLQYSANAQLRRTTIVHEIKYGKTVLRFEDSMFTPSFTSYYSDSSGRRTQNGHFIYMKFEDFDFLMDTAGLTAKDSSGICRLNLEFDKMYVSDSLVFKNTLLSKFRKQSLVVKFDNNCRRMAKWQVIRRRQKDGKLLKIKGTC